jgi:phospholipid/cholesterol/gamma-HCH transport system substrate-binding protein
MVATLRAVLENVDKMTETGSSLEESLKNAARGEPSAWPASTACSGGVLGGEDQARKVIAAIDRANTLLASLGGVSLKMDSVLSKAEQRVFGQAGFVDETQKACGPDQCDSSAKCARA